MHPQTESDFSLKWIAPLLNLKQVSLWRSSQHFACGIMQLLLLKLQPLLFGWMYGWELEGPRERWFCNVQNISIFLVIYPFWDHVYRIDQGSLGMRRPVRMKTIFPFFLCVCECLSETYPFHFYHPANKCAYWDTPVNIGSLTGHRKTVAGKF